jgi:hypothetical protein
MEEQFPSTVKVAVKPRQPRGFKEIEAPNFKKIGT